MAGSAIRISILANASQATRAFKDTATAAGRFNTTAKESGRATSSISNGFKTLATGFLAYGAISKATGFLKDSIAEARESQKVTARTANVIQSMGNVANISAKQVGNLANSISRKTGVDDEAIQSGSNLLLTFGKIRNEAGAGNAVFDRATKAAVDLSASGFGSIDSASKSLGKALNDPIKGITALGRSGVTFTEQQKEQIKTLIASGDTLKAQKIILGEVEKQVGGSAAAQATTGEKLKVTIDNIKESIGTALLPILDKVGSYLVDKLPVWFATAGQAVDMVKTAFVSVKTAIQPVIDFLAANPETVRAFAITLGVLAGALGIVAFATAAWNAVLALNPIGIIVIAIAALVAGLVYAYTHFDTFRAIVDKTFAVVKAIVGAVLPIIVGYFRLYFTIVSTVVRTIFTFIVAIVTGAINTVKAVIAGVSVVVGVIRSAFENARAAVADKLTAAVNLVKSLPGRLKDALSGAGSFLLNAGKQIIQGLLDGIESMIGAVKKKLRDLTNLIPDLKGPPKKDASLLTDAGRSIIQGLIDGFDQQIPEVQKTLTGLTKDIAGFSGAGLSGTITVDSRAAFAASTGQAASNQTITIKLSAQQVSQLQRGREIQADLDVLASAGGVRRA